MVALGTRLRPSDEEVIGQVMDGEAILINLATGSYYALPDVGALIWQSIEVHCSLDEIAARLSQHYDVSVERACADLLALADQLLQEGIVTISSETQALGDAPAAPANRSPYSPPRLSVYSDMRNLLALDPPMPMLDSLAGGHKRDPSGGSSQA